MTYKRTIFSKTLTNGEQATFAVVKNDSYYHAALYVSGRFIHGPALPQQLTPPNGDLTHWMGNHPSVGLTTEEANKILKEVHLENSVIQHRRIS
jgi:hypothetical protein